MDISETLKIINDKFGDNFDFDINTEDRNSNHEFGSIVNKNELEKLILKKEIDFSVAEKFLNLIYDEVKNCIIYIL
jgi:hypothetical protein